jgi:hypothetical protein
MSISVWTNKNPLDEVVLRHDYITALVLQHEQQIKDIEAKLLELKQTSSCQRPSEPAPHD